MRPFEIRTTLLFNDRLAREFLHLAWAMKISVPHDFSVLGLDEDPLESAIAPIDLSSIAFRTREIGMQACQMLENPPELCKRLPDRFSFSSEKITSLGLPCG